MATSKRAPARYAAPIWRVLMRGLGRNEEMYHQSRYHQERSNNGYEKEEDIPLCFGVFDLLPLLIRIDVAGLHQGELLWILCWVDGLDELLNL